MKIRSGFVSNSSSSSFMIIGRKLSNDELKFSLLDTAKLVAVGADMSEGDDVFDVDTEEKMAFIKVLNKKMNDSRTELFDVYQVYISGSEEEEFTIDSNELKEKLPVTGKVTFHNLQKDYRSCENMDELFDKYCDSKNYNYCKCVSSAEVKKEMKVFLRGKKLKKINKIQKSL